MAAKYTDAVVRMCRRNIGLDISIDVYLHQSTDLFYNYNIMSPLCE